MEFTHSTLTVMELVSTTVRVLSALVCLDGRLLCSTDNQLGRIYVCHCTRSSRDRSVLELPDIVFYMLEQVFRTYFVYRADVGCPHFANHALFQLCRFTRIQVFVMLFNKFLFEYYY